MGIGLLKTLTLLIMIRQTVNPMLILQTIILMCLISNANPSPIPSLILIKNPMQTSKTMLLCLISNLTQLMYRNLMVARWFLEKKAGNSLIDLLLVEILEKVSLDAMKWSNFSFLGHVCWTFNHAISAVPQLGRFKQWTIEFLSRIYFSHIANLPKPRPNNQKHVNHQSIIRIRTYRFMSGIVLELKEIIQHTRWNFSWIVLVAESFGWFVIMDNWLTGKAGNTEVPWKSCSFVWQ